MQQIRNYLSRINRINDALLFSSSDEFRELADWMVSTGTAGRISGGKDTEIRTGAAEAAVFDFGCAEDFLETARRDGTPGIVAGRMECTEDWFPLWEYCRQEAGSVYIEYCRESGGREIIEWEKNGQGIELSVVVPVYNVSVYLPKCIETLTEWKAPYVEYIFVNDGSTDGSEDIISSYAGKDSRIKLINKENGGCASARNAGIKAARGRYLSFIDSDDFVDADMLRKLFRRALMGNHDLAYCGYMEYGAETGNAVPVLNDCLGEPYLSGTCRADKVRLLAVKTRVAIWRCIYKKELLDRTGISFHEDLKRFDDLPFRVECIFAAGSAACVPEYLYYYRLGRDGQDTSCTDRRLFVHFDIFEHLDRYTDKFKDSSLKDLLQIVKLQTHGYGLSRIKKAYRREYMKKAVRQLDRNMGYFRTVLLMIMYGGRGNLLWYTEGKIRNAVFS